MTHVDELLSAHLDGELTADETALVTGHLEGCAECRAELAAIAEVRSAVRGLPVLDAPIPLLPAAPRPSRWIGAVASAAAAVLAVGIVFGPGQQAETFDLDAIAGQHTVRQAVDPGISTLRGSVGSP